MKAQKGFTLIELMIVVAIIGILASVAIPMYRDYTVRTRTAAAISGAQAIQTAITMSQNEGVAKADMDAAFGTDAGWQTIGMAGSPTATNEVSSFGVTDGAIALTLTSKVCTGGVITMTPTFGTANTTWAAEMTTDCTSTDDANVITVVDTYLSRNFGS